LKKLLLELKHKLIEEIFQNLPQVKNAFKKANVVEIRAQAILITGFYLQPHQNKSQQLLV